MSLQTQAPHLSHARRDGLYLMLLGTLVFLLFGFAFEHSSPVAMVDFGVIYFPARALLFHEDPYSQTAVSRVYGSRPGDPQWTYERDREFVTRNEYPPTAFLLSVPIAALPWPAAHLLWMALTAACLIFAAFLIFDLCAETAPVLSGALIGFMLANCQAMMVLGNAAGIAVSLCVVGVWCFLRNRYILAGVVCLALSLVLKPHDAWLIWLYFLLAGGVYRKRAWQTLAATAALSLPAVVWVWCVAPGWLGEMRANLLGFTVRGGTSDPGPSSAGSHGMDMLVNLQAVLSFFRDHPRFYQPVTYAICGMLLLIWAWVTLRRPATLRTAWISLASVSALSVLPFYHHVHDAKLILLAVPACVTLLAEGKRIGRIALFVTALAIVCTGDLVWTIALVFFRSVHPPTTWLGAQVFLAAQVFPAPLAILLLGVFYLWVYVRVPRIGELPESRHESVTSTQQPVSYSVFHK